MSDHTPNTQDTPPAVSPGDSIDHSRRKLTGAALGVSAIFTLASRPVFAQCLSASAAMSGNLSLHGDLPVCNGLTPAQWVEKANTTAIPNSPDNNGFPGGNVKFHTVFKSGPDTRLYEVMGGDATPVEDGSAGALGKRSAGNSASSAAYSVSADSISMEFAAALLNIRGGHIPDTILSEKDLIVIWNEWMAANGVYAPSSGVTWDTAQIVAYLRTLQGT